MILEICTADIESVGAAYAGGAQRIELCSALEVGGITPSAGLLEQALWKSRRRMEPIPVNVLIRPRPGDFLYSDKELNQCVQDTAYAVGAGADGIVFGALTSDGEVDEYACEKVLDAMRQSVNPGQQVSATFHRAFDLCSDPFEELEVIIRLGFDRILTSGQAPDAEKGLKLLAELQERADGRIVIMPGGGVTPANVRLIAETAKVTEIHASAKEKIKSRMVFRRDNVGMGASDADEYSRYVTSQSVVRELREKLG